MTITPVQKKFSGRSSIKLLAKPYNGSSNYKTGLK